jgi:flavin reductase (DIM6/NTAB) family NADH-FMN oxidoreductase RutF
MLTPALRKYRHTWPCFQIKDDTFWKLGKNRYFYLRDMPEKLNELAVDSRWPAFFPSPICFVTTSDGVSVALEKVVGPSIVNRFPYVIALSFCKQNISERHHAREKFMKILESGSVVAVQFLPPGDTLDRAVNAIISIKDEDSVARVAKSGLPTRKALTNSAPVFNDAYMVYEARFLKSAVTFHGNNVQRIPWIDMGSHRVYFLEINAIQLRSDIAAGKSQIVWRSLPAWQSRLQIPATDLDFRNRVKAEYQKPYTPYYFFPSSGTIAFHPDRNENGMAIRFLPPLTDDQEKTDNNATRWPCFFPSSVSLITSWTEEHRPNLMPCGSTTVLSRYPLTIAACICYSDINKRYSPRATLEAIKKSGRFGCAVPFIDDQVIEAIKYTGSVSIRDDPHKAANSGLQFIAGENAPIVSSLPLHFDCRVAKEIRLGTHEMFVGEVTRIFVRADVTQDNPLEWYPWADVLPFRR